MEENPIIMNVRIGIFNAFFLTFIHKPMSMIPRVALALILVVIPKITKPQSVSTLMGARSASLATASSTLADGWSLFNNIGGLAKNKATAVNFAFSINPTLLGASRAAASVSLPVKIGVAGAGFFRFGDELYSEQVISVGFANQFGLASLGVKANYIQYRAEGFGTNSVLSLNFGGIAELSPFFTIGAHITNLNQPKLSADESLPVKLATGIQFKPDKNLLLLLELEKDLSYDPTIKGGIEYEFYKKVDFRVGFNLHPNTVSCGVGYRASRLTIDYGLQYNPATQLQYQLSTGYRFNKIDKE